MLEVLDLIENDDLSDSNNNCDCDCYGHECQDEPVCDADSDQR